MKRQTIKCIDLVREEAQYHDNCCVKFIGEKTGKLSLQQNERPQNNIQKSSFEI